MSDSISVRVTLDSFDVVHPSEKQTQVYVQIPGVARASWLLDAHLFQGLKLSPWPDVLDAVIADYDERGVISDTDSTNARAAVRAWLADDANRDEVQAAYELDQARRHPVARKLLEENERLRARLAEFERSANEAPFTEARAAFMQMGRTPSLEGLRAELRIEGKPPLVGRYVGASMGRLHDVPGHEHLLAIDPRLIFEYAEAEAEGGDA